MALKVLTWSNRIEYFRNLYSGIYELKKLSAN